MKYKQESPELNAFLNKKVKITFFDNDIKTGYFDRPNIYEGKKYPYILRTERGGYVLCKSHIKEIKELK